MNTKNEKNVINDKELEEVNGGSILPIVGPVVAKTESEDNEEEKTKLVPLPY